LTVGSSAFTIAPIPTRTSDDCCSSINSLAIDDGEADQIQPATSSEKLPARHVETLWQCVDALTVTERQIAQVEGTIGQVVRRDYFREVYGILTSFPGVALVMAATLIAEIGDFRRFGGAKAIGRYAGHNPRVFASGGKQRMGTHRKDRTARPAVDIAAGGLGLPFATTSPPSGSSYGSPNAQKLVLADATQARALAGRRLKTDREDALNIAQWLPACRSMNHPRNS
jgi:transposase